jgi:hypothetical protein
MREGKSRSTYEVEGRRRPVSLWLREKAGVV